jgi:uncharacterized repeat protein (TIGR01451 family)
MTHAPGECLPTAGVANKEKPKVISFRRTFRTLSLLALAAGLTSVAAPSAAYAVTPAPSWELEVVPMPTDFIPGAGISLGNGPRYHLLLTNVGGATASGPIVVTDSLPPGLEATGASVEPSSGCSVASQSVTCTISTGIPSSGTWETVIRVGADPGLPDPSVLTNEVTVTSPGTVPVATQTATTISSSDAPFGFAPDSSGLGARLTEADGAPTLAAGSHPSQLTISVGWPSKPGFYRGEGTVALVGSDGGARDARAYLPRGLVLNPNVTPVRCTELQLETSACPDASAVGRAAVHLGVGSDPIYTSDAIYNMVSPPGSAANLGFEPLESGTYIHILGGLRAGDYAVAGLSNDIDDLFNHPFFGVQLQFWGDPSSPSHDYARGLHCVPTFAFGEHTCPVPAQEAPFISMPTSCPAVLSLEASSDSWIHPGQFVSEGRPFVDRFGNPTGVEGCNALHFKPTLEARPTTNQADAPSGLSVDLHVPQTKSLSEFATPHLRKAVVKLPPGLTLNPSSANGLDGCSSAQIGIDPNTGVADGNQPTCPDASRVGDVEVDTPLLPNPLPGSVYVATPHDNPFDSLLAIYIVVNDPQTGTLIKLAGHVEADPGTGQLTTTFDDNPQLPFEDFKLSFFGGPGAVLRTPSVCGTYSTTSEMTPWSAPESGPPPTPSDSYGITNNCSSSAATQPNKPEFEAGTVSPIAGKYTPFVVHLKREDGSQQFKTLTLSPPPGLTAKLAGTPACSEAALASAAGKSGRDEQANPSCPGDSQIGNVTVGAGAGPAPYYAKAKAYLAGPYKGAPLSMAIITPAVAGPYDLGTVVTRVALHVNPATAQITADADPVPSILQGIPLDVRSIDVALDKPGFSRTGTSCDPFAVTGNLISTLGQSAALESRYQLGNCANLAFKPKLGIKLKGATKRGKNPALIATLSAKDGEANIASTAVTLPRSAFLDQSHIKTVCTRVQFAAGAGNGAECPAGSIYGTASAKSPLLDYTLTGNAYLRSSNHKLPDLVIALQGPPSQPIAIELVGRTDSVKGALRNSFEAVPDAPVSSFRLELFGGKRGLVVNSRSLCANDYRANVVFGAQNGDQLTAKPKIQAQCPKARKKKHKRHGHR